MTRIYQGPANRPPIVRQAEFLSAQLRLFYCILQSLASLEFWCS